MHTRRQPTSTESLLLPDGISRPIERRKNSEFSRRKLPKITREMNFTVLRCDEMIGARAGKAVLSRNWYGKVKAAGKGWGKRGTGALLGTSGKERKEGESDRSLLELMVFGA